jgi:hypothetical protein
MQAFFLFAALMAPGDAPKVDVRPAAGSIEIEGLYQVEGESGTEKYRGLVIVQKANEAYIVTQIVSGSVVQAIGVRVGSNLSIGWVMKHPQGQAVGTTLFVIGGKSGSPELTGAWSAVPGNGVVHRERLTFLREIPPAKDD